jgi:hypothetical protein
MTVKLGWPAVDGVPETWPPDVRLNPPGKAPLLIVHWYGGVPPAAPKDIGEYAMPTSPLWKGRLATWRAAPPGVATGGVAAGVPTGGDPLGVEGGLVVGLAAAVDGETSGEFEPVRLLGWVQPTTSKTNPATHTAGTIRRLLSVSCTIVSSCCSCGSST